jgi:hypothetical protein
LILPKIDAPFICRIIHIKPEEYAAVVNFACICIVFSNLCYVVMYQLHFDHNYSLRQTRFDVCVGVIFCSHSLLIRLFCSLEHLFWFRLLNGAVRFRVHGYYTCSY